MQTIVEGGAAVAVGLTDVVGGCIYDVADFVGDLLFETCETAGIIAVHFADGQEVAALGVEQEEQTIEEGEGTGEIGFEQVVAFGCRHVFDIGGELVGCAGMGDETFGEMRENLIEDALFEAFTKFEGVAFALA